MFRRLVVGCAIALSLGGCSGALDPHGPEASKIENVWWLLLGISSVIFLFVLLLLAYALWHRRAEADRTRDRTRHVIALGFVMPLAVLFVLMGITVDALHSLTRAAPADALEIDIVGRDWWWDVTYPQSGVRTANEIHIPVGQKVAVKGTSDDVIHSFWSPQLMGKVDLIPGKENDFAIEADKAGTYRGQCAEYCGISHANMAFYVIAQSQSDFDAWLRSQAPPAQAPSDPQAQAGMRFFLAASCSACHGVAGTTAAGVAGPDLTHVMSRSSIAGAALQNTPDNLADWIRNPRSIKPGANMPAFDLDDATMAQLVAYLQTLQ